MLVESSMDGIRISQSFKSDYSCYNVGKTLITGLNEVNTRIHYGNM
jgi:hypothetical protein